MTTAGRSGEAAQVDGGPAGEVQLQIGLVAERTELSIRTIRRMKPLGFTLEEMRQLLDSLAVLADPTAAPDDREAAGAFVGDCHSRSVDACVTLEKQLAYAVEFRDLLAHRTGSGAGTTTASASVV